MDSVDNSLAGGRVTRARRKRLESIDGDGSSRSTTPLPQMQMDSILENVPSKRITRRNSNTNTPGKTPSKAKDVEHNVVGTPTRSTRRRSISTLIQDDVAVVPEILLKQKQLNPLPEEGIKENKADNNKSPKTDNILVDSSKTMEQKKSPHSKLVTFDKNENSKTDKKSYPKTPAVLKKSPIVLAEQKFHSKRKIPINLEESVIIITDNDEDENENEINNQKKTPIKVTSHENIPTNIIDEIETDASAEKSVVIKSPVKQKTLKESSSIKNIHTSSFTDNNTTENFESDSTIKMSSLQISDSIEIGEETLKAIQAVHIEISTSEEASIKQVNQPDLHPSISPFNSSALKKQDISTSSIGIEQNVESFKNSETTVQNSENDHNIEMPSLIVSDSVECLFNKEQETLESNDVEKPNILASEMNASEIPTKESNITIERTETDSTIKLPNLIPSENVNTLTNSKDDSLNVSDIPKEDDQTSLDVLKTVSEVSAPKELEGLTNSNFKQSTETVKISNLISTENAEKLNNTKDGSSNISKIEKSINLSSSKASNMPLSQIENKNSEGSENSMATDLNDNSHVKNNISFESLEANDKLPSTSLSKPQCPENLPVESNLLNSNVKAKEENAKTLETTSISISELNTTKSPLQSSMDSKVTPSKNPVLLNTTSSKQIENHLSSPTQKNVELTSTKNDNSKHVSPKNQRSILLSNEIPSKIRDNQEFETKKNDIIPASEDDSNSISKEIEYSKSPAKLPTVVLNDTIEKPNPNEIDATMEKQEIIDAENTNDVLKSEENNTKQFSNVNEFENIIDQTTNKVDNKDISPNKLNEVGESMKASIESKTTKKIDSIEILNVVTIPAAQSLALSPVKNQNEEQLKIKHVEAETKKISPLKKPVEEIENEQLQDNEKSLSFPKSWTQSVKRQSDKIDSINMISSSNTHEQEVDKKLSKNEKMKTVHFAETMESSPEYQMNVESEEEDEDEVEEEERERHSLLIDDEAECAGYDYQSGDSMNTEEREDYEENKIESDIGESIGSNDTDTLDEEEEENDSFIASDDEEEAEFSEYSDEDEHLEKEKKSKNYKRIVKIESDSDETNAADDNEHETNFSIDHIENKNNEEEENQIKEISKTEQPTSTALEIAKEITKARTSISSLDVQEKRRSNNSLHVSDAVDSVVIIENVNNEDENLSSHEEPTTTTEVNVDKEKIRHSNALNSSKYSNKSLNENKLESSIAHEKSTSSILEDNTEEVNMEESMKSLEAKNKDTDILNESKNQSVKLIVDAAENSMKDLKSVSEKVHNNLNESIEQLKNKDKIVDKEKILTPDSQDSIEHELSSSTEKHRTSFMISGEEEKINVEKELHLNEVETQEDQCLNEAENSVDEDDSSDTQQQQQQQVQNSSIDSQGRNQSAHSSNSSLLTLESGSDVEHELLELIEATASHQPNIKSSRRQTIEITTKTDNLTIQKSKRTSLYKFNTKEKELSKSFVECLNECNRQKKLPISGKRKLSQSFCCVSTPEIKKVLKKPKFNSPSSTSISTPIIRKKNKTYQDKLSSKTENPATNEDTTKFLKLNTSEELKKFTAINRAIQTSQNILSKPTKKSRKKPADSLIKDHYESKRLPNNVLEAIITSEENLRKRRRDDSIHQHGNVFKTNAGTVIETEIEPPKPKKQKQILEILKTTVGNFIVEPSSPIPTKKNYRGFQEVPITPINPGWRMQDNFENENITKEKRSRWIKHAAGLVKVEKISNTEIGAKKFDTLRGRTQKLASGSNERARNFFQTAMERSSNMREDSHSMLRRKKFIQ